MVILAAAFALFMFDFATRRRPPLFDDVGLVYGVSFAVFLFFDTIGRQAAAVRRETDAGRPVARPRPVATTGGQRVPTAPGVDAGSSENVRDDLQQIGTTHAQQDALWLTRIQADDEDAFQALLDQAVRELLALEDRLPVYDANGHVTERVATRWLSDVETNAFFIQLQTEVGVERAGCCVIDRASGHLHLGLIYVIPALRRQHIGRDAMRKLVEFARLATGDDALLVDMPSFNHRGRRFLAACGFRREDRTGAKAESDIAGDPRNWHETCGRDRFRLALRNR